MMRRKNQQADPPPLRAATLTLLLAAVMVCLALLGVLCLATARADLALARRQLDTAYDNAAANLVGAQWYRQADQYDYTAGNYTLPDNTTLENGVLTADLPAGARGDMTLHITADATQDGVRLTSWELLRDWNPDEGRTLWNGE